MREQKRKKTRQAGIFIGRSHRINNIRLAKSATHLYNEVVGSYA